MKKIAFDVMGNDNGVRPGIEAVIEFLKKNLDYIFILVGDKKEINKIISSNERVQIIDVPKTLDSSNSIKYCLNDKNSMTEAIKLVKNKKADAVISQGNSGYYMALCTFLLKRIDKIDRSCFMTNIPTIKKNKHFLMLDLGANILTTSKMIEQWSILANLFFQENWKIKNPRVGIINIGTEEYKGNDFQKEAHLKLKNNKNINYIGFIEPRELLNDVVDVAVVDGYGGNLILKSIEGTFVSFSNLIKTEIKKKLIYKIGALLSRKAFKNVKEQLDYKNVGAAWVFGIKEIAIKVHGSSDKQCYYSAFKKIANSLENNVLEKIKKDFNE